MDYKGYIYEIEEHYLSQYATRSSSTKGRERAIEECPYRTEFMRDRDRIIHSKAFRRLKHKTQVFYAPDSDHYRTRLTHTLEVQQIGRTIARALRLNEDLVEAIALGHDLGHTPFGHAGERILSRIMSGNFRHNEQSIRVVSYLENDGKGLNLTYEVLDGIVNHRISGHPSTLEGQVVRYADRIAYISHDIDDAIRAGVLMADDLPLRQEIGESKGERIDYFVHDVVDTSYDKDRVYMSDVGEDRLGVMRQFMFDKVYMSPVALRSDDIASEVLGYLYNYYIVHLEELPPAYLSNMARDGEKQVVIDYISSMSDNFAMGKYEELRA